MTQNPLLLIECPICQERIIAPIVHLWNEHRRILIPKKIPKHWPGLLVPFCPGCGTFIDTGPLQERHHMESCEPLRIAIARALILQAAR